MISVNYTDILGVDVTLVGTAAFKAVCGAGKVLAGFDSQTFPQSEANDMKLKLIVFGFFFLNTSRFVQFSAIKLKNRLPFT